VTERQPGIVTASANNRYSSKGSDLRIG
jgi:hypothetical protein